LFLDEIECLSPRGQVVLLRFLQDRGYRPLGGRHEVTANIRIVAASNTKITDLVSAGGFREDLMYRLAIVTVTMPPLRDRLSDIALLATHLLRRFARDSGTEPLELDAESMVALAGHRWPGNVRELENVLHRALLMADGPELRIRDLSTPTDANDATFRDRVGHVPIELGFRRAKEIVIAEFERAFLARALGACGGNVSRAARLARKERRSFGRLLKKHGLREGSVGEVSG
jgi:DNA-binding NtrC family response regulator